MKKKPTVLSDYSSKIEEEDLRALNEALSVQTTPLSQEKKEWKEGDICWLSTFFDTEEYEHIMKDGKWIETGNKRLIDHSRYKI